MCVYPRGYWFGEDKFVTLFLELADDTHKLPQGWELAADCSFSVICQHDPSKSHKKVLVNGKDYYYWGYSHLISLEDLRDPKRGYLVNDTVIIEAKIKVKKTPKTR